MLRENWLDLIALALAFAGMLFLFFYANLVEPETVKIENISEKDLDKFVQVQGFAEKINIEKNVLWFEVNDGSKIKIVKFNYSQEDALKVRENSVVKIIGKIGLYKGDLQIIARKIQND